MPLYKVYKFMGTQYSKTDYSIIANLMQIISKFAIKNSKILEKILKISIFRNKSVYFCNIMENK